MDWKKIFGQPRVLLLLVVAGALLMMGNWVHGGGKQDAAVIAAVKKTDTVADTGLTDSTISGYEKDWENRLTNMLNQMQGVGDATVLVNIDSSEEVTYATSGTTNKTITNENDQHGGTRNITQTNENNSVVMKKDSTGDVPVVISKKKPKISGVWVEAHGVSDPAIRSRVEMAIVQVLGIPAHRISITEKR